MKKKNTGKLLTLPRYVSADDSRVETANKHLAASPYPVVGRWL